MKIQFRLLILISVITTNGMLAFSQSYYPFPDTASWKTERCFHLYAAGYYDEITFFSTGQDTIINSISYKKLYRTYHHLPGTAYDTIYTDFMGGYRESNKKIYVVCTSLTSPDSLERMIYDFKPTFVGDTIFSDRIGYSSSTLIPHLVTSIDSVLVGSNYHRRIYLQNLIANYEQEYWIEGVGSNFGLTYSSYNQITDNSYDLICFKVDDNLLFQNSAPLFGFCTAPFPPAICDNITIISAPNNLNDLITLSPNPNCGHFTLSIPFDNSVIRVYNSLGQLQFKKSIGQPFKLNIELSENGMYFVQVNTAYGIFTEKIIVDK